MKLLAELELLKEPLLKYSEYEEGTSADELLSSNDSSVGNSPVKTLNKEPSNDYISSLELSSLDLFYQIDTIFRYHRK